MGANLPPKADPPLAEKIRPLKINLTCDYEKKRLRQDDGDPSGNFRLSMTKIVAETLPPLAGFV